MASVELDPVFRQALKLLHSSSTDSAEGIRKYLDELIRQKHGSSRMLVHTLHKKHLLEECRATGSGTSHKKESRRRRRRSSDRSVSSCGSSASSSVQLIDGPDAKTVESHQSPSIVNVDDNAIDSNIHNALFDDLMCAICRGIDVSAKNRLIECTKCNTLYHQECHSPQIKDAELVNGQELLWHCNDCRTKKPKSLPQTIASPHKSNQSPSSSSSSSSTSSISNIISTLTSGSSKKDKDRTKDSDRDRESSSAHHSKDEHRKSSKSSSSSSKHHSSSHHSSSSSSHKHDKSSGSSKSSSNSGSSSNSNSSSSKIVTPNIQVISADKRLHGSKKKSTKSSPDTKRKK